MRIEQRKTLMVEGAIQNKENHFSWWMPTYATLLFMGISIFVMFKSTNGKLRLNTSALGNPTNASFAKCIKIN